MLSLRHFQSQNNTYLIELVGSRVVRFCARNVNEDRAKDLDGVSVASHHHVRKSDIVVHGNVARSDFRVECLYTDKR